MWEKTPWYFEGIDVVKNLIFKIIYHINYNYANPMENDSLPKDQNNLLSESKELMKYFLESRTLISFFGYMSFDEKIIFVNEVLKFSDITNDIENQNEEEPINIIFSNDLKEYKQDCSADFHEKCCDPRLSTHECMQKSPFSVYNMLACWLFERRCNVKNITQYDVDKLIFDSYKKLKDADNLTQARCKLSKFIESSQVYKDIVKFNND